MANRHGSPETARHLVSLKARGATVVDGLITLPRGASTSMRADAEYVCAHDDRYDWRHEEDAE